MAKEVPVVPQQGTSNKDPTEAEGPPVARQRRGSEADRVRMQVGRMDPLICYPVTDDEQGRIEEESLQSARVRLFCANDPDNTHGTGRGC